jgi:hypothetical protein
MQDFYSLQPILPFVNTDLSSTKMCLDTSIFMKGNMGRRSTKELLQGNKLHCRLLRVYPCHVYLVHIKSK